MKVDEAFTSSKNKGIKEQPKYTSASQKGLMMMAQ